MKRQRQGAKDNDKENCFGYVRHGLKTKSWGRGGVKTEETSKSAATVKAASIVDDISQSNVHKRDRLCRLLSVGWAQKRWTRLHSICVKVWQSSSVADLAGRGTAHAAHYFQALPGYQSHTSWYFYRLSATPCLHLALHNNVLPPPCRIPILNYCFDAKGWQKEEWIQKHNFIFAASFVILSQIAFTTEINKHYMHSK